MPLSKPAIQRLMFAFVCFVWGTNWVAMKVGITAVPPGYFSGTRWAFAGLVLLAWRYFNNMSIRVPRHLLPRLIWLSLLMITFNAFIMLYGLRHVSSGLASVLSSAVTPIALLGFAVMFGQERFNARQVVAIGVGIAGLLLLFGPKAASGRLDWMELLGAAGILIGNLSYCLGSVLCKPLMGTIPPALLVAVTNLFGGIALLVLSIAFEPGVDAVLTGNWGLNAWIAWMVMVFAGSLGATIIYFFLVRDWGASRAGTYAFISPIIGVFAGIVMLGEQVAPLDAAGMTLMLLAAALVLRRSA